MNTFPEQYEAAVQFAKSHSPNDGKTVGPHEFTLDADDQAFLEAARQADTSGRNQALLVFADKLQEDGHEDLAHLVRHGVENGYVGNPVTLQGGSNWGGVAAVKWQPLYGLQPEFQMRTPFGKQAWHAMTSFYFGDRGQHALHIRTPTADPTIKQHAVNIMGENPHSDRPNDHWAGKQSG